MADKMRLVSGKCCIAIDMIRMHMCVDDVADRQRRMRRNGAPQRSAFVETAATVDHRNASCTDDEADVCNCTAILGRCCCVYADMHENTGRQLADPQCRFGSVGGCRHDGQRHRRDDGGDDGDNPGNAATAGAIARDLHGCARRRFFHRISLHLR